MPSAHDFDEGYAPLREVSSSRGEASARHASVPLIDEDEGSSSDDGEVRPRRSGSTYACPIIDPSNSTYLIDWDGFIAVLLLCVAALAPFEAAFLTPKLDGVFVFNRFVDCAFLVDMTLQFFIGFADPMRPTMLVKEPRLIARNYMTGWFTLDLISVLPVDCVCIYFDPHGDEDGPGNTWTLEIVRLLRLVRLVRLARFKRLLHRWYTSFGMSFAELSLYKFLCTVLACCHWMACLWGGLAVHMRSDRNWLTSLQAAKGGPDEQYEGAFQVYTKSLYWAVVTLT